MVRLLNRGNLNRLDLSAQIRILVKFSHDLPRNFVYKNVVNEHRFTPVTHMTYSDTQFGRYGFLKSGLRC
jgi:hypothetical protein